MNRTGADPQRLCELLRITRPVLGAPMASVSGGRLASAVSDAGGLGFIGGGYGDAQWISHEVGTAEGHRVGIGLITWNLMAGAVESALTHSPAAVLLSFGDPSPHLDLIRASGAVAVCQVGSVGEARIAVAAGADVIVAQGSEAGGHGQADRPLEALVAAVSAAVPDLPLVAAGGITTAEDYRRVRSRGAAGVMLGTALYATDEALDSNAAKARLVTGTGSDTIRGTVYDLIRGPEWPKSWDGRCLRTVLTDEWAGREDDLRRSLGPVRAAYDDAVEADDMTQRVIWAGTGVGRIDQVRGAAEIVAEFPPANPQGGSQ